VLAAAIGLGGLLLGAGASAGCGASQANLSEPLSPASYSAEPNLGEGLEVQAEQQAEQCAAKTHAAQQAAVTAGGCPTCQVAGCPSVYR
jgi:hypothetical protein